MTAAKRSRALHAWVTHVAPAAAVLTLGTLMVGAAAANALGASTSSADGSPDSSGAADTSTAVTLFPPSVAVGQQFRITATVSTRFVIPTGWVDFDVDGTAVPTCQHVALVGPVAHCLLAQSTVGTRAIRARFHDSSGAFADSTGAADLTVTTGQTLVVVLPATSPLAGVPFTPIVLVTPIAPASGHPTGTVTLTDDVGGPSCTITLPATVCELPGADAGRRELHAHYNGDDNFADADAPAVAQLVLPGSSEPATTGQTAPEHESTRQPSAPQDSARAITPSSPAPPAAVPPHPHRRARHHQPMCGALTAYPYCAEGHTALSRR